MDCHHYSFYSFIGGRFKMWKTVIEGIVNQSTGKNYYAQNHDFGQYLTLLL